MRHQGVVNICLSDTVFLPVYGYTVLYFQFRLLKYATSSVDYACIAGSA